MRDLLNWNISLGRWAGVPVRLHVVFVLLVVFAVVAATRASEPWPIWYAAALPALLLAAALVHEAAHGYVAYRFGGGPEQVVVWPLGGLLPAAAPHEPRAELLVALAGPALNLVLAALLWPAAWLAGAGPADVFTFLPPAFNDAAGFSWAGLLAVACWVNLLLATVNLVPGYPLDGGRALRAGLWLAFDYRAAVVLAARVGQLAAVALWIAAWLVYGTAWTAAALPLLLLGVVVFFSARQEAVQLLEQEREDTVFGYDFSQGYTSLERDLNRAEAGGGALRRWLEQRREARLERQRQLEAEEERRVDEILARLQQTGLAGLTAEERSLLDRVSARLRNRQRQ